MARYKIYHNTCQKCGASFTTDQHNPRKNCPKCYKKWQYNSKKKKPVKLEFNESQNWAFIIMVAEVILGMKKKRRTANG